MAQRQSIQNALDTEKPNSAAAVIATLRAKKEEEKPNVYTVGPIVLDEEKKSVTVDGDEVALTPIEFNILRLLMKNPGRIYSSAQIYELVWKEDSLGAETSVSVHIRHLRQKLEINPDRKSTRLNSSHMPKSRMPSSA